MRKFLLASFLCFISTALFSQIEKGAYQVGGTLQLNKIDALNGGANSTSNVNITTRGALFLNDKISTGLFLNYRSQNQGFDRYSRQFGYGFYARWHKPVTDNLYFFIQASINHAFGKSNPPVNGQSNKETRFGFSATPGLIYFVTRKIGIELTAGSVFFNHVNSRVFDQKFNSYGVNLGINSLSLGASIYL